MPETASRGREVAVETWRRGDPLTTLAAARARGALLFVPTESSYGVGVDPGNRAAVEAVYDFKGREGGKPLPVVVADAAQVATLGIDPDAPEVAAVLSRVAGCWPGPLTVLLPLPAGVDVPAAAGTGALAVRVPAHDGLRRILAAVGPLTATSANPSGEAPVTEPQELRRWLAGRQAEVDAVLVDAGSLPGGAPSTLVALDASGGFRVLRPGRLSAADLEACLDAG